ncbi:MAG: hypothetical protein ACKN89_13340 [Cyanobium sp.]|jgi:hypothetical protein
MQSLSPRVLLDSLRQRISRIDDALVKPGNVLTFLVIRFLLMSGLIAGFTWVSLRLQP